LSLTVLTPSVRMFRGRYVGVNRKLSEAIALLALERRGWRYVLRATAAMGSKVVNAGPA